GTVVVHTRIITRMILPVDHARTSPGRAIADRGAAATRRRRATSARGASARGALRLPPLDLGREVLEGVLPERAVVGEPLVDRAERTGVERVDAPPALGAHAGEAGVPQHLELLRDGRLRDPELLPHGRDDLARRALALGEQLDDAPPDRVAEYRERVHRAPTPPPHPRRRRHRRLPCRAAAARPSRTSASSRRPSSPPPRGCRPRRRRAPTTRPRGGRAPAPRARAPTPPAPRADAPPWGPGGGGRGRGSRGPTRPPPHPGRTCR